MIVALDHKANFIVFALKRGVSNGMSRHILFQVLQTLLGMGHGKSTLLEYSLGQGPTRTISQNKWSPPELLGYAHRMENAEQICPIRGCSTQTHGS